MNENFSNLQQEAINENTFPERLEELADIPELAHLVATNINTSPKTFTKLAENSSVHILKALVSNPSTPTEILIKLGVKFPKELAKNPIINFWLLELVKNPLDADNTFTSDLARNPNTPIQLLTIIAQSPDYQVRSEVAKNPNTSVGLLQQLANNYYISVHENAALAENSSDNVMKFLVSNPSTPTEILIEFGAKFPQELVKNPIVDLWLLEDDNPLYRYNLLTAKLARNPDTPINLLKILIQSLDYRIRCEVASNRNIPINLLEKLATDAHKDVRRRVAFHRNTPISLLEKLATDAHKDVRLHIVYNQNTPISLLEKLATDADESVRCCVARHNNISVHILERLVNDSNDTVRLTAREKLKTFANNSNE